MYSSSHFSTGSSTTAHTSPWMRITKELAATATAVVCYHPVQTIVTDRLAGTVAKRQWTFREVYRGFGPGVLASHQLFLISALYQAFKEHYPAASSTQQAVFATLSGAFSAVTVTPCMTAMLNRQRQTNIPLYRGFVPMTARQAGLGMGIFVLPEWLRGIMPEKLKRYPALSEFSSSLVGGLVASLLTQPFEGARVLMQTNRDPTLRSAMRSSVALMCTRRGVETTLGRMAVVCVASSVVRTARVLFDKMLEGGKKS